MTMAGFLTREAAQTPQEVASGLPTGLVTRAVRQADAGPYDLALVLGHLEDAYVLLLGVLPEELDPDTATIIAARLSLLEVEADGLARRARVLAGHR
jgi:hypothetical protein